ncbi:MAG: hypothetical protein KJO91_09755, partial [Gammaproteobacteria bacterium]|nr:hypothetical protein [Gammaproteobacteria bacterium]
CNSVQHNKEVSSEIQVDLLQGDLFPEPQADFALDQAPDFLQLPLRYQKELNRSILPVADQAERFRRLRRWIYRKFEDYDFDITETYSLTQLNNSRKINCLSFSALFVAAARYVDVPADFQLVFAPPYWDRLNNSWINNQHINVTGYVDNSDSMDLSNRVGSSVQSYYNLDPGELYVPPSSDAAGNESFRYVVDINPAIVSVNIRRQIIDEQRVLSLFYSNKSVEKLLQGDLGAAYQYSRSAINADPDSSLAWNNLGVLYNRVDSIDLAIASFERSIELDDGALSAKSNLARLYSEQGLPDLAVALEEEVNSFRNQNPYYHAALAEESLTEGDLGAAKSRLESAIDRKHNEFYFYHQLAIVNQQLGDMDSVIENLQFARRHARGEDRTRFSGKLRQLEELLSSR